MYCILDDKRRVLAWIQGRGVDLSRAVNTFFFNGMTIWMYTHNGERPHGARHQSAVVAVASFSALSADEATSRGLSMYTI